mgnify:CR=1 FL=1
MKSRVLVLGAGFGGMELSTLLSEALGEKADVTVIEKSDSFVFGYSKIDVMFGRATAEAVRLPYRNFVKPGVRFVQETITAIDPVARRRCDPAWTADTDAHSRFSDGTYGPEELAAQARRCELAVIALTDHDSVEGCPETARACAAAGDVRGARNPGPQRSPRVQGTRHPAQPPP